MGQSRLGPADRSTYRQRGDGRTRYGARIGPKLSQSEIAQLLGVTREAANKKLNASARDGILTFEAGHLTLQKQDCAKGPFRAAVMVFNGPCGG
ncbi:helix-turn-helix domain-containing protein [Algihabitans albus]|uniref:helix-turn-helix domain-containing protein n=1 Tax=Algihabitans albus TaxID=2164067 RepID=UPI0035CF46F3